MSDAADAPEATDPSDARTGRDAAGSAPRAPRRRWLWPTLLVALALLGSAPWWGPRALGHLAFFRVRRIEIRGARYIAARDILRRLNVDTASSVWAPTGPLVSRVLTQPGIVKASVRRRLPGTLVVVVEESPPVALVPAADGFRVYDARGMLLPIDLTRVPVDAPIARQRDTTLLRLLGRIRAEAPAVYRRLDEARRQGRDELVLHVDSLPVRTMTDVTPARLLDLEPVEQDLAKRRARVAEIDLRFRDQVIARLQ